MLLVAPTALLRRKQFVGTFAERLFGLSRAPLGGPGLKRVDALDERRSQFGGQLSRIFEAYSRRRPEAGLTLLAAANKHENPSPRAGWIDPQIKVAAIGMPARLR